MGCGCGKKKEAFKEAVSQPKPLAKPVDILDIPDEKLTPRQIRIKHRIIRINNRRERVARRIARAQRLANSASQAQTQNSPS